MAESKKSAVQIAERLAAHRQVLIQDLHQLLKDTLFSGRSPLHPARLQHIAQAEADAFLSFLRQPDSQTVAERGARLCQEGIGVSAVLRLRETLWQFCREHLARRAGLLTLGQEAVGTYHVALMEGFIQAREALLMSEQEHIRSALVTRLDQYAAENVQLFQTERAYRQEMALAHQQSLAAREQEQQRIARELHDHAVQQLLGVNYRLALIRRKMSNAHLPDQPPTLHLLDDLATARREVLQVATLLRSLISELRPPGLGELGLTNALKGYVEQLVHEGQLGTTEIELDLDDSKTTLPEMAAICLFRVAQESLRNALKHARAQHIWVSLRLSPDEAVLRVRDDGCGFRVPARLSELISIKRFGLVGMDERVTWVDGQLTLHSQPGMGTQVCARIPLTATNVE